ncbi:MAG TPA: hypothetical protein HA364_05420 [Thermoplasmata archaeon]|nr:hypothetical protein [Thermoplasmata archaeon]
MVPRFESAPLHLTATTGKGIRHDGSHDGRTVSGSPSWLYFADLIVQTARSTMNATVEVNMIVPRGSSSKCIKVIPERMPINPTANASAPTTGGRDLVFVANLISEDSHTCTNFPVDGPKPIIELPAMRLKHERI